MAKAPNFTISDRPMQGLISPEDAMVLETRDTPPITPSGVW